MILSHQSALTLKAVCLVEKQQLPTLLTCVLTKSRVEPTIYRTRGNHANHYTTDAVLNNFCEIYLLCVLLVVCTAGKP